MKTSLDRIDSYMNILGIINEQISEDVWIIHDPTKGLNQIVVFVDETLVTLRCKTISVEGLDEQQRLKLYETLLKLNLEMVHGAYALEDTSIVVMDTLELETMDLEEFQASLEAIGLAVAQHYRILSKYAGGSNGHV